LTPKGKPWSTSGVKPILFLDVDGVLNAFPRGYEKRRVQLDYGHVLHFTKYTKPFMRWAWSEFEVCWCTAWGERANLIADWASLPRKKCIVDIRVPGEDWKLKGVRQYLKGKRGPAVWIEDGIGEEAEAWARKRGIIYVETGPRLGVTKGHALLLADTLGLSLEGWRGNR